MNNTRLCKECGEVFEQAKHNQEYCKKNDCQNKRASKRRKINNELKLKSKPSKTLYRYTYE